MQNKDIRLSKIDEPTKEPTKQAAEEVLLDLYLLN